MNTVYAPDTITEGETFLWYRPTDRLQVGVAYLWQQAAFRALGNYELIQETDKAPNLRVGFGIQGISTGNPGYFATSEKNWKLPEGDFGAYVGIGFRSNENHAHMLGGFKFSPANQNLTLGVQLDGHRYHPFVTTVVASNVAVGAYWIETKSLGIMVSVWK